MDIVGTGPYVVCAHVMFTWVVCKIFDARVVIYRKSKSFCTPLSSSQKSRISMLLDFRRFIVLFTIPTVMELSMCIGVGGWI